MKEKHKNELKSFLEEFGEDGEQGHFSTMLSKITQLTLDSIRQVKDFDERVRAFSFFAINFKKFLLKSSSGFVGGVYWQCNVDSMAEQCGLLDEKHSIMINLHEEDGKIGSVVRFVERAYESEKVMNSLFTEMQKTIRNHLSHNEIDFPQEMPES